MKRITAIILSVFIMLSSFAVGNLFVFADNSGEENNFKYNGHTYKVFTESMTWTNAKERCEELGGHLVTITSSEEQEFVADIIINNYSVYKKETYWIGLYTNDGGVKWNWITGEPVEYNNIPNNGVLITQNKYAVIYTANGQWDDNEDDGWGYNSERTRLEYIGFICEWDTSYSVGDIIEFGSYPQTEVKDEALISNLNIQDGLWKSYDYYSGTGSHHDGNMTASDYMRYKDVTYNGSKYRAVIFDKYRPYRTGETSIAENSYQDDNGYTINKTYWFKYEPIKWKVLDPASGFVMCVSIIDNQPFNNYSYYTDSDYWGNSAKLCYANNYANSSIRQWLNNDFYNLFSTSSEKSLIVERVRDNTGAYYSSYDCNSTLDKITLLSSKEACDNNYGFASTKPTDDLMKRAYTATDYARCQGLCRSDYWYRECYRWSLRTACSMHASIYIVSTNGDISGQMYSSSELYGIRPVLNLDLNSETFSSGFRNYESPVEYFEYEIVKDEVTVTYYKGDETNVGIPSTIEGYPVKKIDGLFSWPDSEDTEDNSENIRKIESLSIPLNITEIKHNSFSECKSLETIYYAGSLSSWNLIKYQKEGEGQKSRYFENAELICKYKESSSAKFIDGYIFIHDSYNFKNLTDEIPFSVYENLYGTAAAFFLHMKDKGTGGQCVGMADSTAYLLNKKNNLSTNNEIKFINQLNKNDTLANTSFTISDIIKYGYVLQDYSKVASQIAKTENDFDSLYLALASYFNGGSPVIINIKKNVLKPFGWGHTVLPVGMKETGDGIDIYLNDSLNPNNLTSNRIHLKKENGKITWWNYTYLNAKGVEEEKINKDELGASISYCTPVEFLDYYIKHQTLDGNTINTDTLAVFNGIPSVSVGGKSVAVSNMEYLEDICIPINSFSGVDSLETASYYWIDSKDSPIEIQNVSAENNSVFTFGNTSISFSLSENDSAILTDNKDGVKTLTIITTPGNAFSYTFASYDKNGNEFKKVITGTAESSNIEIEQNENSFIVKGSIDYLVNEYENDTLKIEKLKIKNYNSTFNVDYKSTVIFHTTTEAPEGFEIVWSNDEKGSECKLSNVTNKEYKVSAKIVNKTTGETKDTTEEVTVTVNTGFFAKIIAFFRNLFGLLPTYEDFKKK